MWDCRKFASKRTSITEFYAHTLTQNTIAPFMVVFLSLFDYCQDNLVIFSPYIHS